MPFQHLENRSLIIIAGDDATSFLQGLITANVETLETEAVQPSALLTPQGKIAYDFLIGKKDAGFFVDLRDDLINDLLKRLQLYKLRANVELTVDKDTNIYAIWDEKTPNGLSDARFPTKASEDAKITRYYGNAPEGVEIGNFASVRIEHGVAVSGQDFEVNDIFPHDIGYDLNDAVDFKKGCYVGQEVVSRMKHRGTARKRPVIVSLPDGFKNSDAAITADGKPIGNLGTISGNNALAIVRLDRPESAEAKDLPIKIGDFDISITVPQKFKPAPTEVGTDH